jgi:hypothetical protein
MTRTLPAVLAAGWALLIAAWVAGNPPFASPDEVDHYRRAIGISQGDLIGNHTPEQPGGVTDKQREWNRNLAYSVEVPAGMGTPPIGCYNVDAEVSADCYTGFRPREEETTEVSQVGNYQPFPYLAPAVVLKAADSPFAGDRLGRAVVAILCVALLLAAALLLHDPRAPLVSLLGLLAAVTPMTIFLGGSLAASGLEICAAIAFAAALLRISRGGEPPGAWYVAAVSGAVLALTRALGPVWVLFGLAAALLLIGPREALVRARRAGLPAAVAGAAVLVAVVLNRVWEAAHGADPTVSLVDLRGALDIGAEQVWGSLQGLVGQFSALEYELPLVLVLAWFAAVLALLAAALRVAAWRDRLVLAAVVGAVLAIPFLLYVAIIRHTGFGLQSRYVLPIAIWVPLLAGELLYRRREALGRGALRALAVGVPVVAAVVQLLGWWLNARRAAVGTDGSLLFPGDAEWSPPLGWIPWALVAAAGALLLASAALEAVRRPAARR